MRNVHIKGLIFLIIICIMPINLVKIKAEVLNNSILNRNLDVSKDMIVDVKDLAMVAQFYNVDKKMTKWQSKYDFNSDDIIDIFDLSRMAKLIGSKIVISDVITNIEQGKSYSLPETVSAKIGNNYYGDLSVKWNSVAVNTSKIGKYSYTGTILDYNKPITLTLNVKPPNNANINNYGFATFDGTWVYYGNPINEGKLSKAKIDGSGVEKINDDQALFINVQENYIYYCNVADNYSIYKVNKDGTGRIKLTAESAMYLRVYNNSIYYQNINENYSLYRMNLDGSNNIKVVEDTPMYINLYEQYMYYSNFSNGAEISRLSLDDSSKINLNTTPGLYISVQDNYLFYQDYNNKYIYRMNVDGTNVTLVKDVNGIELNAVDGWVYYINGSDGNTLHRVNYDGSIDQKLNDFNITDINIIDDRIFLYDETGYLYSSKLDGTDLKPFGICRNILKIDDQNMEVGQGDYCEFPDKVLAVMTDGSELLIPVVWNSKEIDTSIKATYKYKGVVQGYSKEINLSVEIAERGNSNGNVQHEGLIVEKNGWEYFRNEFGGELYKIKSDGTYKIKLSDDEVRYINVIGDWIYYRNDSEDNKLYKVKIDGTLRTLVCSDSMDSLNIVGNWVFYSNASDNNYLYKIKTDGTNKTKLSEERVYDINIMGNWIYYLSVKDVYKINRINKDGYQKTQMYNYLVQVRNLIVSESNVYAGYHSGILEMNLDGSNQTEIAGDSFISDYTIAGNKIYYYDNVDYKLRVMNNDGTGRKVLSEDTLVNTNFPPNNMQINGDWIYYEIITSHSRMNKIKNDGTGRQKFGMDLTIKNIEQFSVSVKLGETYNLPSQIIAIIASGEKIYVPISWTAGNVNTSKLGSSTYEGSVNGYSHKVQLTVTVVDKEVGGNAPNQDFVAQSGDWVIVNNFKMKADGTQKGGFHYDYFDNNVSVVGDWAYYANFSNEVLKKVKIDGTGSTEICDDQAAIISIFGDWIYYKNNSDGGKIYKIRLSGLDKTKVTDDIAGYITIAPDGWIYYENKTDPSNLYISGLWKIKTDGTGRVKLSDDIPSHINVVGEWIYYKSNNTTISKIKTDGSSKTFISNVSQTCGMKVVGDWIYLADNTISKMKIDGSNLSKICNRDAIDINVLNEWIYLQDSHGNYFRIRFDGSNEELLYNQFGQ